MPLNTRHLAAVIAAIALVAATRPLLAQRDTVVVAGPQYAKPSF